MYQALYRKWRPQTFDQVVGQQHITETLKNQVKSGRLSHAYLFIGTRGTGKTTCARILAKAVNCLDPQDGNPCGKCAACRGIQEGGVLDVVELDAASNNGVDHVRALREEAVFSPASVKKRVYIIDEVHMLSTAAFNALLKILEEPPEHLMFILATTELHKVPATVLSRCQRHSFRRLESAVIAPYLEYVAKQEKMELSSEAAALIARLAEGGVRDALSLLDQCSGAANIDVEAVYSAMGLAGKRRTSELFRQMLSHNSEAVLKEFSALWMDGKDPASFLAELSSLLRDILMLHVAPKGGLELLSGGYELPVLQDFARQMTQEELLCALSTVQQALTGMRDVKNPKTAAELCLLKLCDNTAGESVESLRARISRLEKKLEEGIPMTAFAATPGFLPPEEEELPWFDREEEYDRAVEGTLDELEVFQEEQPEDSFLQRREEVPAPALEEPSLWEPICERLKKTLPMHVAIYIQDPKEVQGRVEGDILRLEVLPGFRYDSFNRQNILNLFAEAASAVAGREIRVQLSELKAGPRQKRDLSELEQFPEVHVKN